MSTPLAPLEGQPDSSSHAAAPMPHVRHDVHLVTVHDEPASPATIASAAQPLGVNVASAADTDVAALLSTHERVVPSVVELTHHTGVAPLTSPMLNGAPTTTAKPAAVPCECGSQPAPCNACQSKAHSFTQAISAYNSPKDTLLYVMKAGMAKSLLPLWQILLLSLNAGFFLALSNLAAMVIAGGLSAAQQVKDPSGALLHTVEPQAIWSTFAYGAIFPLGLVIIVLAGSELFTGNVMYLSVAWASGKITFKRLGRNLALVWVGNFAGAVLLAFFLAYLPEIMHTGPQHSWLTKLAHKKLSYGWGNAFLRGVGCNWLVCLALWCNLTAQDVVSKLLVIWFPISLFVWAGWEHSVANMFSLPLALMEAVTENKGFGEVLAWNIIPVTLGNIVGGTLFALGQIAAYGTYAKPKTQQLTTKYHAIRAAKKQ